LAAITVALELGVPVRASKRALSRFAGVGRRAQSHGFLKRYVAVGLIDVWLSFFSLIAIRGRVIYLKTLPKHYP